MKILKLVLPAILLTAILFTGGRPETSWAEATSPTNESMPARDIATSAEDISLTNICIEDGKEKLYCLCVTKIFKNEMTLRQYRGAIALYKNTDSAAISLIDKGYSQAEIHSIDDLKQELSSEDKFRTRCHLAETYFAAAIEG